MGRRLLVALLAACVALPAVAVAADNDPQKRFTAADQAKARLMLLKQSDLGLGWTKTPVNTAAGGDFHCPGYDPDLSDLTQTGEAMNGFVNGRGDVLYAYASFMKSAKEAGTSWRRANTAAAPRCMARAFAEGVAQAGGNARVTSYGRVAFPRVAPRVAAFRATISISGPDLQEPISVKLHVVMLGYGRADVALMGAAPFGGISQANLRALSRILAKRLASAAA